MASTNPLHGIRLACCGVMLAVLCLALPGCGKVNAKTEKKNETAGKTGGTVVPIVAVFTVKAEDFKETLDLPGASVHGMETTPLMSKVAGFVKIIRRVGNTEYEFGTDRVHIQISDTFDTQTRTASDLRFRVTTISSPAERKTVEYHRFENPDKLKEKPADPKSAAKLKLLVDAYQKTSMLEIDIGSLVDAGTLLAVIDVPEMKDDVTKQKAEIARTVAIWEQMKSAKKVADERIKQRQAEKAKAAALKTQAVAERDKFDEKLKRVQRLYDTGSVPKDVLLERVAEAAVAKAAVTSAKEEINSATSLVAVAVALAAKAVEDVNAAKADETVATAALAKLKTMDQYRFIKAPYRGTITRRMVDHGEFVRPATNSGAVPLFEITRIDWVRIVVPVPGSKSYKISIGQDAVFHTIGGLPAVTVDGTVTRMAATLNKQSRMMRVEIYVHNPAANSSSVRQDSSQTGSTPTKASRTVQLLPGMFGTIRLHKEWKGREQLRKVPTSAVATEDGQYFVMEVVAKGGKLTAVRRYVSVVYNDAQVIRIRAGIEDGNRIVVGNPSALKDGQEISLKSP